MKIDTNSLEHISGNLKKQEYDLKRLDDHQIVITGIPTMTKFMAGILISVGVVLVFIGIVSFAMAEPEILSGTIFVLVGLSMSVFPFYIFYSKKSFKIVINKDRREVYIRDNIFFTKPLHIHFDDINSIVFKETDVNTFVDDKSKKSTVRNFTLDLNLKDNTKPTLIRFRDTNTGTKEFSDLFTNYVSQYIDKNIEFKLASE